MRNRILSRALVAAGVSAGLLLTGVAGTASAHTAAGTVEHCKKTSVGDAVAILCVSYKKHDGLYDSTAWVKDVTPSAFPELSVNGVVQDSDQPRWLSAYPSEPKPMVFGTRVCNVKSKKCSPWVQGATPGAFGM